MYGIDKVSIALSDGILLRRWEGKHLKEDMKFSSRFLVSVMVRSA